MRSNTLAVAAAGLAACFLVTSGFSRVPTAPTQDPCEEWCVENAGGFGTECETSSDEPDNWLSGPHRSCTTIDPPTQWCETWAGGSPCTGCEPLPGLCGESPSTAALTPSGLVYANAEHEAEWVGDVMRVACNGWAVAVRGVADEAPEGLKI